MSIPSMEQRIEKLRERRAKLELGGGADKLEKHRASGKQTARERVESLVDPGSFQETGLFAEHRSVLFGMAGKETPADGVVTGAGSVNGRLVHLASQDFTVLGGSAGELHSSKVAEIMLQSLKTGTPFVFINDSGGARVQEGIDSLSGYGKVFYTNVMLSGAVPQVSLICGPCAGGAAYSPALTDFIIQTLPVFQRISVWFAVMSVSRSVWISRCSAGTNMAVFPGSPMWRSCIHPLV